MHEKRNKVSVLAVLVEQHILHHKYQFKLMCQTLL
jgi:hypothetical protein